MNRDEFDTFITNELKGIKTPDKLKHKLHNEIVYTIKAKKRNTFS